MSYNFTTLEKKWQKYWQDHKTFATLDPVDAGGMKKAYVLDMFPYPSGAGLHVGHPIGWLGTDIVSRYLRMTGHNVLHPMGWDAFGLPAEQYAIKNNVHPAETTKENIENFRRQIQMLGLSYDWDREVDTTDPTYYKWTQWIFLQLYNSYFDPQQQKAMPISHLLNELNNDNYVVGPDGSARVNPTTEGLEAITGEIRIERQWRDLSLAEQRDVIGAQRLAFVDEVPVNWCPQLGTVLSNEEVIDGKSEVGGFPVERRPLRQWMLRITSYADRLVKDLDLLQWPDSLKEMQRNWIGKSVGAEIDFDVLSPSPGTPGERRGGVFPVPESVETTSPLPNPPPANREREPDAEASIITVFTTRPDTLYGATYMVLAPEHELVETITTPARRTAVDAYRAAVKGKSDRERMEGAKDKTGVFTGAYAVNPINDEKIPVWIADYVLTGYGTGAIMAVPAHDERDFAFAKKFGLPIKQVVAPRTSGVLPVPSTPPSSPSLTQSNEEGDNKNGRDAQGTTDEPAHAFAGEGTAIHSDILNGLPTKEAAEKVIETLERESTGLRSIKYKLRDWLFSRQRYWGEPFPIVLDDTGNHYAIDESELPLTLPEMQDFKPTGTPESPLTKAKDWIQYSPSGNSQLATGNYVRETNTMPQWAGSCWYYLRYIDPKNPDRFVDPEKEKYWMPVDLYVGGVEHAVLHLLYARFWHKVLFDLGHVSTPEPFARLVNQGLILGEMEYHFFEKDNQPVSAVEITGVDEEAQERGAPKLFGFHKQTGEKLYATRVIEPLVEKKGEGHVLRANPSIKVDARSFKMSKSRGNVVNPDKIVEDYGADTFRLYEMYMGPLEAPKPWNTRDIVGMSRFLNSVWRNLVGETVEDSVAVAPTAVALHKVGDAPIPEALDRQLHRTIKKVADDIVALRFNVAIAELIKLNNEITGMTVVPRELAESFVLMLAPFAPHVAEEIWERLGHHKSLARRPWPSYDESKLVELTLEIPVQVNGKLRDLIVVPANADEGLVFNAALSSEKVKPWVEGKTMKKKLYVPKKLVNFVVE